MSEDDKPDLNELLEHYGSPTKLRVSYMTRCPLHDDRTPSFSVNTDKGLWNCHSCGERGDAYTLIMKKEEIDFVGARAFAATLGLATGGAGGSDSELSGSAYGGRRKVAGRKGDRPRDGGYVPAWRRR